MDRSSTEGPLFAVLDYGMGNLRSVTKAFECCGARVQVVAGRKSLAVEPDAMVLPGVGALRDCVEGLQARGLDHCVREWIAQDRPFFGICLGMQALFEFSEENGGTRGLGIFPGQVKRFQLPADYKIPHMGWNAVAFKGTSPLTEGLPEGEEQFYFVHSYYCAPEDSELVWGQTDYGGVFCSAVRRGNAFATQFHPEKSQALGLQMYRNCVSWAEACAPQTR